MSEEEQMTAEEAREIVALGLAGAGPEGDTMAALDFDLAFDEALRTLYGDEDA